MSDYQLIVIGAGPGGYTAALEAAKLGLHTAVAERREVGGTCLNRGCIPTKTLLHASQVYRDAVDGSPAGVHAGDITFNLAEMFAYKRAVSEKLRGGIHALLKGARVDLLEGTARIDAPGRVTVAGPEGDTVYTADRILAATGSVPVRPPIPGLDLPGVMTSDELLEGSDSLYESLVIMGGGVIGVEFATFYANLGCRVTLIEGMDRLLPTMDRELGQNLGQILKKQGVEVLTSAMVRRVEQTPEGLTVHVDQKGKEKAVSGEKVLCAIGRRPCWDGLFAPELVPETRGRSLLVDEDFRTSIPGVYAIGDVSAVIQLAHVAAAQGIAGLENTLVFSLGSCGLRPGGGLREPAVRGGRPDRPERGAQLHLQQSRDRRGGPHRGRGQGAGHQRRVRQVHHVRQRPDGHRGPGPLLHEAGGRPGYRPSHRRAADVPARQRHHQPAQRRPGKRPDGGAAAVRYAAPSLLRGGHDRGSGAPGRKAVTTYTGKRSPPGAENLPRPGVFVAFAIVKCLVILYIVGDRAAGTPISCVYCTESTKYPGDFRQAFSPYLGLWACISTGYGI